MLSVEHPVFTAPSEPGGSTNSAGRKAWPVDSYLEEGPRSTDWLAKGVIKQHRTEWGPTQEQIAATPSWADERQRPPFLLIAARRQ